MKNIQEEILEEFDIEFPEHDSSHCTGHDFPEFENHVNRLWVINFIEKALDRVEADTRKEERERIVKQAVCEIHEFKGKEADGTYICIKCGKVLG